MANGVVRQTQRWETEEVVQLRHEYKQRGIQVSEIESCVRNNAM